MAGTTVYDVITDRFIQRIEQENTLPWRQPWDPKMGLPRNALTGKQYRGINFLMLWHLHEDARYATMKQANQAGGKVRKGAQSIPIVFWTSVTRDKDNGEEETIPIVRYYRVFHVGDIEGATWNIPPDAPEMPIPATIGDILRGMPDTPVLKHDGQGMAYYEPLTDSIHLPPMAAFSSPEMYAGTVLHELVHSTGHVDRLDRDLTKLAPFGSDSYSREELTAEIGASFVAARSGIPTEFDHHASYVAGWLKILMGDSRAIVIAAGKAQKAADYILGTEVTGSD